MEDKVIKEELRFELASEIATKISSNCTSSEDADGLLRLVRDLLEVRWSLCL